MPDQRISAKLEKITIAQRWLAQNVDWRDLGQAAIAEITEFYFKFGLLGGLFMLCQGAAHDSRPLVVGGIVALFLWFISFACLIGEGD